MFLKTERERCKSTASVLYCKYVFRRVWNVNKLFENKCYECPGTNVKVSLSAHNPTEEGRDEHQIMHKLMGCANQFNFIPHTLSH